MQENYDYQELANAATNYKKLKATSTKRGRSCIRKEKRGGNHETRILRDRLAMHSATREFHKEAKAFEKMQDAAPKGVSLPEPENLKQLKEMAKFHKANLASAIVAKDAMSKYPPLSV